MIIIIDFVNLLQIYSPSQFCLLSASKNIVVLEMYLKQHAVGFVQHYIHWGTSLPQEFLFHLGNRSMEMALQASAGIGSGPGCQQHMSTGSIPFATVLLSKNASVFPFQELLQVNI